MRQVRELARASWPRLSRVVLAVGVLVPAVLSLAVVPAAWGAVARFLPPNDNCDGVELGDSLWFSNGPPELAGVLGVGYSDGPQALEPAFIFPVSGIARGDSIAYARFRITSVGSTANDTLRVAIRGLYKTNLDPFTQDRRPSTFAATQAEVTWDLVGGWPTGGSWDPMYIFSPDLAPVLNEIFASPMWPQTPYTSAYVALSIEVLSPREGAGVLYRMADTGTPWSAVVLEVYRTRNDAFLAPPLLSRPTDRSVTISFAHLNPIQSYVGYGEAPDDYRWAQGRARTELPEIDPLVASSVGIGQAIEVGELAPSVRYYGRIFHRREGSSAWVSTPEFTFGGPAARDGEFAFAIVSDSHLEDKYDDYLFSHVELYKVALRNVALDQPDFLIDLGDFALTLDVALGVRSLEEARRIYWEQRSALESLGSSTPFFLVVGNHEGEGGWLDQGDAEGIFGWSTRARKEFIPNPRPNAFYSGNSTQDPRFGHIENYYSWEWGDALFVVLDPARNTMTKPHRYGGPGSMNGWDWTLGVEQYEWLVRVLEQSDRTWKFVFTHHLTGGALENMVGPYGRGGIEAVRHHLAGRPTFEWGGEDASGNYIFEEMRPDFLHGDVHSILVRTGVTAVFHGHDHCYFRQELDGVIYQECPMPSDASYSSGFFGSGGYENGVHHRNSGHLRVTVSPAEVRVEYVRAFLQGDGDNRSVEYAYVVTTAGDVIDLPSYSRVPRLAVGPVPSRGVLWIRPREPVGGDGRFTLHDLTGRTVSEHRANFSVLGALRWELRTPDGRPLPNGTYQARLEVGGAVETRRILVVR